ncbi:MAG: hypothetical protein AB2541_01255 [Candidatus Thiodiazotropha sp.]
MDANAFLFNSQAKYRAGGHFKEKSVTPLLSLANQQIMVDDQGSHFQAMFLDIFSGCQNHLLTGDVTVANKAWNIWTSAPFTGGSASLISLSGAPLPMWCFI